MKPKHQRLIFVLFSLCMLAVATALILTAFKDNLVYFYSPTELVQKTGLEDKTIRVGGLVKNGSIRKGEKDSVTFAVTDMQESLTIHYTGILPALFREGQGVVAEGILMEDGTIKATQILAKHDENYMPPEVADALKKSGRWKGTE